MTYFLWRNDYREGYCVVKSPAIDRIWELDEGISREATFPSDLTCPMDRDYPNDVELSDNLYGTDLAIVSGRIKEIVEREAVHDRIEFLPLRVRNHKGRLEPDPYYLLHPLDCIDCIDLEASGVEWNQITSDLISRMKGLVLRPEKIPADQRIFRLKFMGFNILIHGDLATSLETAGLTGLVFRGTDGYTGIG